MRKSQEEWDSIAQRLWDLAMQLPVPDDQPFIALHHRIVDTIEIVSFHADVTIPLSMDDIRLVDLAMVAPEGTATRP